MSAATASHRPAMVAARDFTGGMPTAPTERGRWLVSARWDVTVFGGSAGLAFALLVWGRLSGTLAGVTPPWAWIATVLVVDVAHVWSTAYRVYLDPDERLRRPLLYLGVPVAAYAAGVVLYSTSAGLFWRVLAYLAVFRLFANWGATRTTLVAYLIPVVGIVLGYLVLQEPVDARIIIGTALVIAGVGLVNSRFGRRRLFGRVPPIEAA